MSGKSKKKKNKQEQIQQQPAADRSLTRAWYKLGGETEQTLLSAIEAQQNGIELDRDTKRELAGKLGLTFAVAQRGQDHKGNIIVDAVFPSTFSYPLSAKHAFYMHCPIGVRKGGETAHFVPADSERLSEEDSLRLESTLFNGWGGSVPITQRAAVTLTSSDGPQ